MLKEHQAGMLKEQQAIVSLLTNAFSTLKNFQVQSSEETIDRGSHRGTDSEQQSRAEPYRQQQGEERVR